MFNNQNLTMEVNRIKQWEQDQEAVAAAVEAVDIPVKVGQVLLTL